MFLFNGAPLGTEEKIAKVAVKPRKPQGYESLFAKYQREKEIMEKHNKGLNATISKYDNNHNYTTSNTSSINNHVNNHLIIIIIINFLKEITTSIKKMTNIIIMLVLKYIMKTKMILIMINIDQTQTINTTLVGMTMMKHHKK